MDVSPLISVIVPFYNAEEYLMICIESVLAQTYHHIELLLINDGSADNSNMIAERYREKDDRIILIRTENKGVSCARNTGIQCASGQYIMFVDADDCIAINAIEVLYNDICRTSADISIGRVSANTVGKAACGVGTVCWTSREAVLEFITDNELLYGCVGKLYKACIASKASFPPGRRIHEDSLFILQCLMKSSYICIHDVELYYYRHNNESASHAIFSEKYYDILDLGKIERELIEHTFPEYREACINVEIKANLSMLHMFCNTKGLNYQKDINACIRFICENKKYYLDGNNHDRKWMWIVTHHLFWPYKWAYGIKYRNRIR